MKADTLAEAALAGQLFESLVTRDLRVYAQPAADRVCSVSPFTGPEAEQIAEESVTAVVAAAEPDTIMRAMNALQVIARHPVVCS